MFRYPNRICRFVSDIMSQCFNVLMSLMHTLHVPRPIHVCCVIYRVNRRLSRKYKKGVDRSCGEKNAQRSEEERRKEAGKEGAPGFSDVTT